MGGIGLAGRRIFNGAGLPEANATASIASSVRPQSSPPGIGLASLSPQAMPQAPQAQTQRAPAVAQPPMPQPGAPAPAQQQRPQQKPLISFKDNPLGAIGLVLSNVAAGMRGQPLPTDQLRSQMRSEEIEQSAVEYRTAELGMKIFSNYVDILGKTPPEQHDAIIADAMHQFGGALGGNDLSPTLKAISSGQIKNAKALADFVTQFGNPNLAAMVASNPEFAGKIADLMTGYAAEDAAGRGPKTPEQLKTEATATAEGTAAGTPQKTPAQIEAEARASATGAAGAPMSAYQRAQIAQQQAATDVAGGQRGTSQENTLRGEFIAGSKDFVTVKNARAKIKSIPADSSGAGDMQLVFGIMKMFDPTSNVLPGEYANAENAGGVAPRIMNLYNKTLTGEFLTAAQRADFKTTAERLYTEADKAHRALVKDYEGKATRTGANPQNVIVDYLTEQPDPLGIR